MKSRPMNKELAVVPDSCWLLAYLDREDVHHVAVTSCLGMILPYRPVFYIPAFVYIETLSKLRRRGIPLHKCQSQIDHFLAQVQHRDQKYLMTKEIFKKYRMFSRKKITQLTGVDFYIATEGIMLNAKILTCDKEMYNKTIRYYPQIYFVSDQARGRKSDLDQLIRDIQKEFAPRR